VPHRRPRGPPAEVEHGEGVGVGKGGEEAGEREREHGRPPF